MLAVNVGLTATVVKDAATNPALPFRWAIVRLVQAQAGPSGAVPTLREPAPEPVMKPNDKGEDRWHTVRPDGTHGKRGFKTREAAVRMSAAGRRLASAPVSATVSVGAVVSQGRSKSKRGAWRQAVKALRVMGAYAPKRRA